MMEKEREKVANITEEQKRDLMIQCKHTLERKNAHMLKFIEIVKEVS